MNYLPLFITGFFRQFASLVLCFILAGCATQSLVTDVGGDRELTFEEQIARYSEDKLGTRETDGGVVAVGIPSCEVTDAEEAAFDALLPISGPEKQSSETRHAEFGLPVFENDNGLEVLLHHNEYILAYNTDLKLPTYAIYRLDAGDVTSGNRKDCFREDPRLPVAHRSTLQDYDEPIFDQGHLVPVGDMHRSFPASVNTFYMSNMMPQSGFFNSGPWKVLEDSTRLWAVRRGSIYVLSGPIFDRNSDGLRDLESDAKRILVQRNVAEPTHFFKIFLHKRANGFIDSMTFVLPHTFVSTAPNVPYVTTKFSTIDEVEALSGYDFFSELPDAQEAALESFRATELWERRD